MNSDSIKTVCVHCGSSARVDDVYKEAAVTLGREIASEGWNLVYGGARVGLMNLVAESAMEYGSHVTGVMPEHIMEKEIGHSGIDELIIVDTMHNRKQLMVDKSDAFVTLPGGIGTMDEFFELIVWKQLAMHDKPIVVVNKNGYWDPLLKLIDNMADKNFMRQEDKGLFLVVDRAEEVVEALKNAPREKFNPSSKWI